MSDAIDELGVYVVPDLTMKELLGAIPAHCFERSAVKSSMYTLWHLSIIGAFYKAAVYADAFINPETFAAPYPVVYPLARFALWSLYGFWAGLFGTGIWVIGGAMKRGIRPFPSPKLINNTVGWILHSAVGVPYHSWRITHAKHHASTGHMTQDQVWVPSTRTQRGLKPFDPKREDRLGARASEEVKKELWDALGDSPIGASWGVAMYLLVGWPAYIIRNASGQRRYPKDTNHFTPSAVMFSPHHWTDVVLSDIGVGLWLAGLIAAVYVYGALTVFTVYGVPYLWVNHWLVLITFLQHTDPLLPHYRAPQFTFPRGALSTLDRSLLGDLGSVMAWIGAHATCGISETHILHHVCSKIPHYNAWEATDALRAVLAPAGVRWQGAPGGWAEMYRVFRECKFVEDEGDVVFYKNAHGLAKMRPVFSDNGASDSGVEIAEKRA